jgi:ParB-like chromosome segregation protein Spo0J
MAAGWSVMDALNKNSKAAAEEKPKARFRTRDISIRKIYSNDRNFYSMPGIEQLAQEILAVGLMENMTVAYAPCERGEYKIIAGERRWRALNLLLEKGYEDFETVTCQIKSAAEENEEMVQLIIANAYRDKTIADMLEEEKRLKESLQYMKDNGLTLQGYKLDSGRLRDVIASIMNTTGTKIAQIESINKHLIPEFSAELKEGRLTFSAAYEISGMAEDKQMELLEKYKEGGLSLKEVKQAKKEIEEAAEKAEEEQEEEWQQAHPESITSLCYSCQRYSECNVKTGTCQDCDRYVDKAEAEKTPEQRYDEEQAAIDRETAKKLTEMEQEEKMQNLPSDEKKARMMRVSAELFKDIKEGKIRHMIVKEDQAGYREKEILTLLAFCDGRSTGEQMRVCITCADDAQTSSAIIEGYAVIGIMDVYDAEALGLIDLGDED